jgi:hypothetical protein
VVACCDGRGGQTVAAPSATWLKNDMILRSEVGELGSDELCRLALGVGSMWWR